MKTPLKNILCLFQRNHLIFFAFGTCVAVLAFCHDSLAAVDNKDKNATAATLTPDSKSNNFKYILENRPDPFIPFITEKAATQETGDMNEIIDTNEELTGMQVFEPGQLTLVALVEKEGEKIAMVQDFTGKGYVIKEGTKIGKRGIVKDIVPNKVLIEETAQTRAGKKIITHTDMVLKKEGEK